MTSSERRSSPRQPVRRLVALRCREGDRVTWTGFATTLNLSQEGVLLELPDRLQLGQKLGLEFLLDEDKIVQVEGAVNRVTQVKKGYHIAVVFDKPSAQTKRLLAKQATA